MESEINANTNTTCLSRILSSALHIMHASVYVFILFQAIHQGYIPKDIKFVQKIYKIYNFIYTGCHRRKGPNFGRVFLMLNYTDITQNTYIQSLMVTEIMAREKCGHLAFPRSVRLQLSSALTVREECVTHFFDGTNSAQRDKIAFHYCRYVQCLVTLRTTVI